MYCFKSPCIKQYCFMNRILKKINYICGYKNVFVGQHRQSLLRYTFTLTSLLPVAVNPYVIITCEGERVRSPVYKDTRCPNFDIKGLFYRKKPKDGIHVEVRGHSTDTVDSF